MSVQDPGQLTVICDGCGEEKLFDTSEYAGDPPSWGVDDSTLEADDWLVEGVETYCPECKAYKEKEEQQ